MTVDPVSRVWISGAKSYLPAQQFGDVIPSFGIGKVIETKSKKFDVDDVCVGVLAWS